MALRKPVRGKVEVLLLERFPDKRSLWIALINAAKKPKVGSRLIFRRRNRRGNQRYRRDRFGLETHPSLQTSMSELASNRRTPLPPYVRRRRVLRAWIGNGTKRSMRPILGL